MATLLHTGWLTRQPHDGPLGVRYFVQKDPVPEQSPYGVRSCPRGRIGVGSPHLIEILSQRSSLAQHLPHDYLVLWENKRRRLCQPVGASRHHIRQLKQPVLLGICEHNLFTMPGELKLGTPRKIREEL